MLMPTYSTLRVGNIRVRGNGDMLVRGKGEIRHIDDDAGSLMARDSVTPRLTRKRLGGL